jgi:hypothetical protein
MTQKKLIPKPLRGSKSPLIWRFIKFLRSKKIRPQNIDIKWHRNSIFFLKNGPKPFQAGCSEDMFIHSISAKPQQRPKNRRLLLLLTKFGKKIVAASSQAI